MDTLFISGSGFNLFLQAGALKYINHDFHIYAGTSSGSFLACALALGWTAEGLFRWVNENNRYLARHLTQSYWRLLFTGRLVANTGKQAFVRKMIEDSPLAHQSQLDPETLTFDQLTEYTGKYFLCNATNYQTSENEIFSVWTTPEMPVFQAIQASMSLLILFAPLKYNGKRYIDGMFNEDYLPAIFQPGDGMYYRLKYPEIEIPISLDRSWGVLFNLIPSNRNPPGGRWTFWSLLHFAGELYDYLHQMDIDHQPKTVLNERTWTTVYSNVGSFPSNDQIKLLFDTGYEQAKKQGRRGLPSQE